MTIDWSKAPVGTTGAMVADFNCATVKRGDTEWIPSSITPKDQYQVGAGDWVYHEAPQQWDGKGLPPVGKSVCEYLGANQYDEWSVVNIFAHHDNIVFVDYENGWRAERDISRFRPIRTPEQIEADQKNQEIQELMIVLSSVESAAYKDIAIAIQQANFRKQVAQ